MICFLFVHDFLWCRLYGFGIPTLIDKLVFGIIYDIWFQGTSVQPIKSVAINEGAVPYAMIPFQFLQLNLWNIMAIGESHG